MGFTKVFIDVRLIFFKFEDSDDVFCFFQEVYDFMMLLSMACLLYIFNIYIYII